MDRQIRVSRRALLGGAAFLVLALVVVAVLALPGVRERAAAALDQRTVASHAELVEQRGAAEGSIGRAYAKALDQLRTVRGLTLPIPPAEADRLLGRAIADLRALRREALAAVAEAYAMPAAEAAAYVDAAEARLERIGLDDTPVLLAPRLYAIVLRMNQAGQQIADRATEDMTRAPATPSPSPRPGSPSPSPGR